MKKAHPMEERFRYSQNKNRGGWVDNSQSSPTISLETMIRYIKDGVKVDWDRKIDRKFCDETYKDGAKIFDQAMNFINSPLNKALE